MIRNKCPSSEKSKNLDLRRIFIINNFYFKNDKKNRYQIGKKEKSYILSIEIFTLFTSLAGSVAVRLSSRLPSSGDHLVFRRNADVRSALSAFATGSAGSLGQFDSRSPAPSDGQSVIRSALHAALSSARNRLSVDAATSCESVRQSIAHGSEQRHERRRSLAASQFSVITFHDLFCVFT